MAFLAEDGTGLEESNSFTSVAYADDYFTDRGNTTWEALTSEQKQVALIKSTDYIEQRWSESFWGAKLVSTQALSFPRTTDDAYPVRLKKACCEYAFLASQNKLLSEPDLSSTGQLIKRKRERILGFEEEIHYDAYRNGKYLPHPTADALIRPLIKGSSVIR